MPTHFRRRDLLLACLAVPIVAAGRTHMVRAQSRDLTWVRAGIAREVDGELVAVFGLEPAIARDVLLRVTRSDALPDGYAPADLVSVAANGVASAGGQTLRALVVPDARALVQAAADQGHALYVGSGYRSQAYQVDVFAAQVARWGDDETANHYSARPGHSQHQLGTTIDFTTEFRAFRTSGAATWLRDNAHRFGFILPYTAAAIDHTGYIDEPWHGRWVGQALASQLQATGYQESPDFSADDVVALVRSEAGLDG
jgi:LAS superfamily LD-carboxypeptidase LdcB